MLALHLSQILSLYIYKNKLLFFLFVCFNISVGVHIKQNTSPKLIIRVIAVKQSNIYCFWSSGYFEYLQSPALSTWTCQLLQNFYCELVLVCVAQVMDLIQYYGLGIENNVIGLKVIIFK